MPWVDARLTMQPGRFFSVRCRPMSWLMKNTPFRLTDISSSHSARVISSAVARSVMAALFTSASSAPNALAMSAIARFMLCSDLTSSSTGSARAPAFSMRPSVSDSRSTRRDDTATSQPSRASATAISCPRPCEAPVTKAVRRFSLMTDVWRLAALFSGSAHRLDDLRPELGLVFEKRRKLLRRLAGHDLCAAGIHALDDFRIVHRLDHHRVELAHDGLRRVLGDVHRCHDPSCNSGKPDSAMVGTCGIAGVRLGAITASTLAFPVFTC